MEKQWSTDIRNGPEGSLVGIEIWDFRSWKRNAAISMGRCRGYAIGILQGHLAKMVQVRGPMLQLNSGRRRTQ